MYLCVFLLNYSSRYKTIAEGEGQPHSGNDIVLCIQIDFIYPHQMSIHEYNHHNNDVSLPHGKQWMVSTLIIINAGGGFLDFIKLSLFAPTRRTSQLTRTQRSIAQFRNRDAHKIHTPSYTKLHHSHKCQQYQCQCRLQQLNQTDANNDVNRTNIGMKFATYLKSVAVF